MLRLYERESQFSARSRFYGYLWFCPYKHFAIVDHRTSDAPELYELGEALVDG